MKKCCIFAVVICLCSWSIAGNTWYVSLNSATDGPGTAWSNAFHVIQSGVDAASDSDTVMVASGIYNIGTNVTPGHISYNCVVITNNITVQSVDGAAATIIDASDSFTRRGVYMSAGVLQGFSIINGSGVTYGDTGYDMSGGGVNMYGGSGQIVDCVVSNNSCRKFGGGVYGGSMSRCIIANNVARESGGGLSGVNADSSAVYGNKANLWGGGAYGGVLVNSSVSGNQAAYGGGIYNTAATNSIIWSNNALYNENWDKGSLAYCCTHPLPSGTGNFDADPLLLDGKHIKYSSPCVNVANTNVLPAYDIDNEAWTTLPAIGCDQPTSKTYGDLTGSIVCDYSYAVTGKVLTFRAEITGIPESVYWSFGNGYETDKNIVSRSWNSSGSYNLILRIFNSSYPSGLTVSKTISIYDLSTCTYYVDADNINASEPYTDWTTAASNIQDAVNMAENSRIAGAQVVVTDGVYNVGETYLSPYFPGSSNRVVISQDIVVKSVNGPEHTFIKGKRTSTYNGLGNGAVRCVYMSAGHLEGFTLTNGYTRSSGDDDFEQSGGGANLYGGLATISDCIFATNSANNHGGGVYFGKVEDSVFANNYSLSMGGAAMRAVVSNCQFIGNNGGGLAFGYAYNCNFTSNHTVWGGAAYQSDLYNCNVIGNRAEGDPAYGGGIMNCNFYGGIISNNLSEEYGGGAANSEIYDAQIITNISQNKSGGGVYNSYVYRSVIAGNTCSDIDEGGGGARGSYLYNCLLYNNNAEGVDILGTYYGGYGGGANNSYLYNCTVVSNNGGQVGGLYGGSAYNCIVRNNSVEVGSNYNYNGVSPIQNCCTSPNPGGSNKDRDPHFMNANEHDYHLRVYSPCVDQGTNLSGIVDDDLDGAARPIDGDVDGTPLWDIGCYEYDAYKTDSDGDEMSDGWEYLNGLDPTNAADAAVDSDGDNVKNINEYIADTSPTNINDYFKITAFTNGTSATVYFKSSSQRAYTLKGCTNLNANVWTDIAGGNSRLGVDGTDNLSDTNPASRIETYRIKVEIP